MGKLMHLRSGIAQWELKVNEKQPPGTFGFALARFSEAINRLDQGEYGFFHNGKPYMEIYYSAFSKGFEVVVMSPYFKIDEWKIGVVSKKATQDRVARNGGAQRIIPWQKLVKNPVGLPQSQWTNPNRNGFRFYCILDETCAYAIKLGTALLQREESNRGTSA